MTGREMPLQPRYPDLVLRSRPNWTAVAFLGLLALLHACNALPAFLAGRWEGYLSACLAVLFVGAAAAVHRARCEVALQYERRTVRTRTGLGPLRYERSVPFAHVRAVRVTLGPHSAPDDSLVEIICGTSGDAISCPATRVPRQQALLLAMMIGVPLVRASEGAAIDRQPACEPSSSPG